jgi:glycosyltransferase involved in cell wall biosynthesis
MKYDKKIETQICIGVMTKNDENTINRCIKSIPASFMIYLLDGGSTDRTLQIARESAVNLKIIEHSDEKFGYDLVRNRKIILKEAFDKEIPYVFFLDSDETLPELGDEIYSFLSNDYDVGMLKHRNIVYGQHVRSVAGSFHGRLITTKKDVLQGRIIESLAVDAKKYYFNKVKIDHYLNHKGAHFFVMKNMRWAHEALQSFEDNGHIKSMNTRKASVRIKLGFYSPFVRFFYHYIFRLGIFEGRAGLVMALHAASAEMFFQIMRHESELNKENIPL